MSVNPHFATFFSENFADSDSDAEFEGFNQAEQDDGDVHEPRLDFNPNFNLDWQLGDQLNDESQQLPFSGQPGINLDLPPQPTPGEIFSMFIGSAEYEFIATEMNRYMDQEKGKKAAHLASHPHARLNLWEETSGTEVRRFFAVIMSMGLVVQEDIQHYWSTDPVHSTPFVPSQFTKNRSE